MYFDVYEFSAIAVVALSLAVQREHRGSLMKVDKIIAYAAQISDIDTGVRAIQDELGIETGDMAGLYFCGDLGDQWPDMEFAQRVKALREYVAFEVAHWSKQAPVPSEPQVDDLNRPDEIATAAALEHGWPVRDHQPPVEHHEPSGRPTVSAEVLRRAVISGVETALVGEKHGAIVAARRAVTDAFRSLGLEWPLRRTPDEPSRTRKTARVSV